jgi:serine/threonine protein kinase
MHESGGAAGRSAAALQYPNVVTIFDSGTAGGVAFLVMELLPSQNLEAYLAERGPLPEQEGIALVREVASGLAAARRSFPNKMKEKSFRNWAALLNPNPDKLLHRPLPPAPGDWLVRAARSWGQGWP